MCGRSRSAPTSATADAVQAAVDRIVAAWGRLDIAVCNAGGGLGTPAESKASTMDLAQFDAVLRRNLYGTVHTCTAVAPTMKAQGSGKIITVSSQAGRRASGDGGYAHYGTAKAAIIMYTKYLAQDLGPHGIQVNCIAPGFIGTGRLMPMFERTGTERLTRTVAATTDRHPGGLRSSGRLPRRAGLGLRHRHRHPDRRRQHHLTRRPTGASPHDGRAISAALASAPGWWRRYRRVPAAVASS